MLGLGLLSRHVTFTSRISIRTRQNEHLTVQADGATVANILVAPLPLLLPLLLLLLLSMDVDISHSGGSFVFSPPVAGGANSRDYCCC